MRFYTKAILVFLFICNLCIAQSNATKPLQDAQNFAFQMGQSPLDGINFWQYLGVIFILFGLLVFLWFIKNRLSSPQTQRLNPLSKSLQKLLQKNGECTEGCVKIQSIETLNLQNKLIVFECYHKRYLIVINQNGASLIDAYSIPPTSDFKDMLEQNDAQ